MKDDTPTTEILLTQEAAAAYCGMSVDEFKARCPGTLAVAAPRQKPSTWIISSLPQLAYRFQDGRASLKPRAS
jgi:hypothetical protein